MRREYVKTKITYPLVVLNDSEESEPRATTYGSNTSIVSQSSE